ncbi:hypothetical protein [Bradyrhizobium sp. Leo170]|uniref:hypothetical protein n=1 Tax=Bradyrhizobium sp. Leo170 TaxID=1571199 RepID=UPI00102E3818|nr:hypothetical protein [Bradyrhizobium sp. Leo170]TAI60275.1 hypothetical protein CWO89_41565 [Bradyrhizobium sp. Leo170]
MGEVSQFVPKAERERARLIRQACAIYFSIFPPADTVSEHLGKPPVGIPFGGRLVSHGDGE